MKDKPSWHEGSAAEPPCDYRPQPLYEARVEQRDVMVAMRDGVHLCVDVYRPDTKDRLPALLAIAPYEKESASPEYAAVVGSQPSWSALWAGSAEAGDTEFLNARGYAHVVGTARGAGKSEGGGKPTWDLYDLIEWVAAQDWCDGNVGMVGISAYGAAQLQAAITQPPHLKAIFPFDPGPAYREFRDRNPGGVLHTFPLTIEAGSVSHGTIGQPGELPPELEQRWKDAMSDPDLLMYQPLLNVLCMKGQKAKILFHTLLNPYDTPEAVSRAEENFDRVKVPTYLGTGWHAQTYKSHLQGAQHWYAGVSAQKRLMFTGTAHLERPYRAFHHEIVRWYDHWLKGIDTGIDQDPAVKVFVMGANRWLYGQDWPLPETQWTPFYLDSWERLRTEPFTPGSRDGCSGPDGFLQMPPTRTRTIQKLRYLSEPLTADTLVVGPAELKLHAAIDQPDTNWFVTLKDVGPDVSIRSTRPGEMELPSNLPERVVTRGWLKASHRALDASRSQPGRPWHVLTREAQVPVTPGSVEAYTIGLMASANLFRKDHRICVEIASLDLPTGAGGNTNVEYIPYHICSSRMTAHHVYHDAGHPSHLLLPIVPLDQVGE